MQEPLELEVEEAYLLLDENVWAGNTSRIYVSEGLQSVLQEVFGRDNLCLKANIARPVEDKDELGTQGHWRDYYNSIIINNIFAMYNIAPRVYGWVLLNGDTIAVVVGHLKKGQTHDGFHALRKLIIPIKKVLYDYPITHRGGKWQGDWRAKNFLANYYVDYSHYRLDEDAYIQHLNKLVCGTEAGGCMQYQPVPELKIAGWRSHKHRVEALRFDELDFRGKTVLGLGCHLGGFLREAHDRGAKRCVGVDLKRAEVAYELNNWLGYWNADFYSLRLWPGLPSISEFCGLDQFDIVFAFSVFNHLGGPKGYSPRLSEKVSEVLLVEGHQKDSRETYESDLQQDFQEVEFLGYSTDQGERPLFRCWKGDR